MSGDPNIHIEKVKQGGYAWIGDKTFIELMWPGENQRGIYADDIYSSVS